MALIFRFRLSVLDPVELPSLSDWLSVTSGLSGEVAWTLGSAPNVTLPSTGPGDVVGSEYLYTEFAFTPGVDYSLTFNYTRVVNSGSSNPRTTSIRILDSDFNIIISEAFAAGVGANSHTIEFTATEEHRIIAFRHRSGSNVTITVNSVSLAIQEKEISNPIGWKGATIGLERHPDFHSLVEIYKAPFSLYGANYVQDGGRDWFKGVERVYGPDVEVVLDVDYRVDEFDLVWKDFFLGTVPAGLMTEKLEFAHMTDVAFSPVSFWTKFINRFETPVNIQSLTGMDGQAVTAAPVINLPLPSQKIPLNFSGKTQIGFLFYGANEGGDYFQVDHDIVTVDEIQERFTLPNLVFDSVSALPGWVFTFEYDGTYDFEIRRQMSVRDFEFPDVGYVAADTWIDWYIQKNEETPIIFNKLNSGTPYVDEITEYTYYASLSFKTGDIVKVYGFIHTNINDQFAVVIWGENGAEGLNLFNEIQNFAYPKNIPLDLRGCITNVLGNTTYVDTESEAFLLHDVGAAITERICQSGVFYSEYLGNLLTSRVYDAVGCASNMALVKGLQVRDYSLTEKPFFQSMKEWWEGANPNFNLGLGYFRKVIDDVEQDVIEVRQKKDFYKADSVSTVLSNITKVHRYYEQGMFFSKVTTGSKEEKPEDISGIDDPYKVTRAYPFKFMGKPLEILSEFITPGLSAEITRRQVKEKSKDNKYDDKTFLISLVEYEGNFSPRLTEGFDAVSNLLNQETRYNKDLTPGRIFVRWLDFLSTCMQWYLTKPIKFASGEGNYDMTVEMAPTSCEDSYGGNSLSEKGDIMPTDEPLFIAMPFKFEGQMNIDQWNAINGNRDTAVGIDILGEGEKKYVIKNIEYNPNADTFLMVGYPKTMDDIILIEAPETPNPSSKIFGPEFDDSFE